MKIGIIGTGNMGRILIESMLDSKAISPDSLLIHNRTKSKALQIKKSYPDIVVYDDFIEVAKASDVVFLCIKPRDSIILAKKLAPYITDDMCVVSITSPINAEDLEVFFTCSVARIIPSITNRALTGVSLFSFGKQCTEKWKKILTMIFENFSSPYIIDKNITRAASDIVSCGPAFFSYLTQRFIDGAVEETEMDSQTATLLASEMLIGLGELLKKRYYTLPTLQEKVCVKGGITGVGIEILEKNLGDTFNQLFHATHEKFAEDVELVQNTMLAAKDS
ncbi:late competence protein ComER [Niallia nealsonii]|uniref:Late competence protein ComER n=1 Tax=Niallia nealsonii TaxID=115979 RepID=A0A2N0Z4R9_9BACI|nr:late competence protein ComER [Niallia nealsonii]PKG24497.1 late competence protein ComER [Niallia nealsonii]